MALWLSQIYNYPFEISYLERAFLKKKKVSTETIQTLCIVSVCILGPAYMNKSLPVKEGHPSSRVNFRERLYEKKVDSFVQAKSARQYCDCAGIISSHIVFVFNMSI